MYSLYMKFSHSKTEFLTASFDTTEEAMETVETGTARVKTIINRFVLCFMF